VSPEDWRVQRRLRLAALAEAPRAFGSWLEREQAFPEEEWRRRAQAPGRFLAWWGSEPVGLAAAIPSDEDPACFDLVGMWVDPACRGRGVGEALVEAVAAWVSAQGSPALRLWVVEDNGPALRLYERCGFALTGERQPYPRDPALAELGMRRPARR